MSYASRNESYLLGSTGSIIQGLACGWGAYSHTLSGSVDLWWNPVHLMFYSGIAIVIAAVCRGLRDQSRPPTLSPVHFVNLAGLKLAVVGLTIQIIAGIWNEITHHFIRYESSVTLANVLLVIGMLTINLGMLVGLSIEYGMMKSDILVVDDWKVVLTFIFLVLGFASVWLTTIGSIIFTAQMSHSVASRWALAMLMSISATVVLVPAKKVLPNPGSAGLISGIFNAFGFVTLVVYLRHTPYVPIGILSALGFDLLLVDIGGKFKRNNATFIASAIFGSLFYVTYYPYTINLFAWTIYPIVMASLILGSVIGAIIGVKIYSAFSFAVLGDTLEYVR
ncbi:MAG: hypothetical protein ACLPY5_01240 [Candidatus Bathyarchaeia archaeon]